jgi:hypothetical protein
MNLDLAIQNTLKRSEMENALHGVMDNYGAQFQLTSFTSTAKGAEAIFGAPVAVMAPNILSRPTTTRTRKAADGRREPYTANIGAGYRLEYSPTGPSWTLYRIDKATPTVGDRLSAFFNGTKAQTDKLVPTIERSGTYATNRFLTTLDYRKDFPFQFKQQVASAVIAHMEGGTISNLQEGYTVDTDPSDDISEDLTAVIIENTSPITVENSMDIQGSQPMAADGFNRNPNNAPLEMSLADAYIGVAKQSNGNFMGDTVIPTPITRSQAGLSFDALGNPAGIPIRPPTKMPPNAMYALRNSRSL